MQVKRILKSSQVCLLDLDKKNLHELKKLKRYDKLMPITIFADQYKGKKIKHI